MQDELFPTLSSTVLKTGTLTDLHVSKYKKIARQEFTSSDITDDNPQTLYLPKRDFFWARSTRDHKFQRQGYLLTKHDKPTISQNILVGTLLSILPKQLIQNCRERLTRSFQKRYPKYSSIFLVYRKLKNCPKHISWHIKSRNLQMPLHHFGGVILNTSAAYTHTETTCWFGWLSGKTNGNKTVQSGWKNSQVCLVLLLKSFSSAGSWRYNSYAQTLPQVLNSSQENLFLHCSPLPVYYSSSKA